MLFNAPAYNYNRADHWCGHFVRLNPVSPTIRAGTASHGQIGHHISIMYAMERHGGHRTESVQLLLLAASAGRRPVDHEDPLRLLSSMGTES